MLSGNGAEPVPVLSENVADAVLARIGRSDGADDRIGNPSSRRARRPVARIEDVQLRSAMDVAVRPIACMRALPGESSKSEVSYAGCPPSRVDRGRRAVNGW